MARVLPVVDGPDGITAVGADPSADRRLVRRDTDRRIAVGGIVVALGFLVAAGLTLATGGATWSALHLALAGGAGTAIGALMPFFAAALVAAPPARPALRLGVIASLAVAAVVIAVAVPAVHQAGASLGAGLYLIGLIGLAAATLLPLRRALGMRHRIVIIGYALGVLSVMAGVSLVTAFLGDVGSVGARWGVLKPAHAWLNLIGFVSLVIVTTLVHLAPTVLGARIVGGRTPAVAVVGLAAGVAAVATGFAFGSDMVARAGAALALVGAVAGPAYLLAVVRQEGRGRWTTDLDWHRFTGWSLVAAACWIAVGIGSAAALVLVNGATPAGWSLPIVGIPLVVGGASQAVVAAATHLVPTLGPGGIPGPARARAAAGRGALIRLAVFEVGILGWWAAVALGVGGLAVPATGTLVGAAVVVDLALLALPFGSRGPRPD